MIGWCHNCETFQLLRDAPWLVTPYAGGLMRYVAQHFQKESQAPPAGWRGHRFLKSRGYFDQGMPEARAEARESLAWKRDLWRQLQLGRSGTVAELEAQLAAQLRRETTWRLVEWNRNPEGAAVSGGAGEGEKPHQRMRRHRAAVLTPREAVLRRSEGGGKVLAPPREALPATPAARPATARKRSTETIPAATRGAASIPEEP